MDNRWARGYVSGPSLYREIASPRGPGWGPLGLRGLASAANRRDAGLGGRSGKGCTTTPRRGNGWRNAQLDEPHPSRASRVLIVDDHAMFRQGLRALLEDCGEVIVVGEAASGLEALERARDLCPDVVLMDIQMPGLDGLDATQRIRQELAGVQVVIVTAHVGDPSKVYEAIKAGAIGYVSKMSDVEDLVKAVKLAAEGKASIATASLTSLVGYLASSPEAKAAAAEGCETEKLSQREREVLELVAQGLTNREISERLVISESTVRSHLHHLLGKLGLSNRVQAVAFALAKGQAIFVIALSWAATVWQQLSDSGFWSLLGPGSGLTGS